MTIANTINVGLRRASVDDAAAIADIGWRVFEETFSHSCSAQDMQTCLDENFALSVVRRDLTDPDRSFLVATVDGTVAAFSSLRTNTTEECLEHIPQDERVELQRLYCDTAFHGRGIAQSLMAETLETARAMGFKHAWLGVWEFNERASNFYKKYGFKTVGSHSFMVGSDDQTDHIMARAL